LLLTAALLHVPAIRGGTSAEVGREVETLSGVKGGTARQKLTALPSGFKKRFGDGCFELF
jgi:hypothetical protein